MREKSDKALNRNEEQEKSQGKRVVNETYLTRLMETQHHLLVQEVFEVFGEDVVGITIFHAQHDDGNQWQSLWNL